MSASPLGAAFSSKALLAAVAQRVHSAIKAREELSARGIRQALEIELCCELGAMKGVILRAIHAALEEAHSEDQDEQDRHGAPQSTKRRKLSKINNASDELVLGDGAKRARSQSTRAATGMARKCAF